MVSLRFIRAQLLISILVSSVVVLVSARPSRAQTSTEFEAALAEIDQMAQTELARDDIGSVTIGVVKRGALIWTKSYGLPTWPLTRLQQLIRSTGSGQSPSHSQR